ncbi:RING-H2 zinc finger domain protein [Metarhizium robertsii]|uniref:DSC E3 ubiquitin ligase complex subunit A n=2 Tax=Metarhizium robertsii TaxID=568076 RepID=E9FB06_METRA|nr:trans-membrane Golgi-localized RING-finger ubiquitin ligase [Metarhizium robertsii ARSEF 23]EFY95128.1 trans-membrane Golgi-localized RING-finger ubiquitin ligase [Metarhizium robertsii ARSEF 23]EXU96581.1 RING-H2 zinc finger domain protein [Metarhizium robertsii]
MPSPAQSPAGAVLFILFLVWMLFPEGDYRSQSLALSDLAVDRLARYRDALHVLNTTRWGDFAPQNKTTDDGREAKHLNLTGFRETDGFAWDDLETFRQKGLKLSRHAVPPVDGHQLWDVAQGEAMWTNASGTVHGDWVRKPGSVSRGYDSYNLSRSVPEVEWMAHKVEWARNVTGNAGRMMLRLSGNKTLTHYEQLSMDMAPLSGGIIRSLRGTATIEDTIGSGLNWEMKLWGVHWPRQGVILMTTTSEKFEGIFALPHLSPGPDFFQSSQMLLNQTLARVIRRKEKHVYVDQRMPWNSDIENPMYTAYPSPHCEYIMYAQVHPPIPPKPTEGQDAAPGAVGDTINAIESELQYPVGAPIPRIPKLKMSAVVYSPDCSFFLETKGPPDYPPSEADHLVGMKKEVQTHQIKTWLLLYALVVFGQVRLLRDQMKESFTPSTMGRISFGTISAMLIVDGMTFTAAATWVSSAAATFLPTLALMFASFLSMTIGGSFLAKIYEVQLPESRGRRDQSSSSTTTAQDSSANSIAATPTPGLLPGPVTASQRVETPIIIPSDQDISAEIAAAASAIPTANRSSPSTPETPTFQAIIGRFILFSLCVSFLAISSSTWYPRPRSVFLNTCAFIYLSMWTPQIYRNTLRNCRRALAWPFVLGQSVLRLLPIAYFWVKEDNFLYATTDVPAFVFLAGWVWIQVVVLAAQQIVGPRFGVPLSWTPDAWDYHPVLREDNLEGGGLPIGLVVPEERNSLDRALAGPEKTGVRHIDCAICREVLEVPVVKAGEEESSVSGVFARRMYMVTPCRHIFHTACLESWLRFRLQCPICRDELPPI